MKRFFQHFDPKYISIKAIQEYMPKLAKIYMPMDADTRRSFVNSDMFKSFFEHKSTCAVCKDSCCERGPCSYSANDFDFSKESTFDELSELINDGQIAIETYVGGDLWLCPKPMFTLISKPANQTQIVTFQSAGKCSQLLTSGCSHTYDERPTFAVLFAATENDGCKNILDTKHSYRQWNNNQRQAVLRRLAQRFGDTEHAFAEKI